MSSVVLTEDQCAYIVNSLQSYFYVRMVKEGNNYVWKKPEFITLREIFDIISDALEETYNDNRDGYIG
jgi:hypothetical protein